MTSLYADSGADAKMAKSIISQLALICDSIACICIKLPHL
jgi:hypothetical protein